MICPVCETERPAGVSVCPECEVDLVDRLPEPSGDVALEPLCDLHEPRVLAALAERFDEARIPYVVQCGTAMPLFEAHGLPGGTEPAAWEARVLVISSRHADADRLVEQILDAWGDDALVLDRNRFSLRDR